MSKLIFTGNDTACSYKSTPFIHGLNWLKTLSIIGFDTETNVTESILNRQLKVMSIADERGEIVWVLDKEYLTEAQFAELAAEVAKKLCIIQNASFDYQVMKKYGYVLEKVYDTMLGEQILNNGYSAEAGFNGLQAIFQRRFNLDISKAEQLTFGDGGPYTDAQIQYAGVDVLKLGELRRIQLAEMRAMDKRMGHKGHKGLVKTAWWEDEFVKAVGDMESTGVRLHKDKWYAIEDAVRPVYEEALENLNKRATESCWDVLEANNWISDRDVLIENIWTSAAKKQAILDVVYNFEILKTSKEELKKLLQEHDPSFPEGLKLTGKSWNESDYPVTFNDKFAVIKLLILNGTNTPTITQALDGFLFTNLREFCIDRGWLRPAYITNINWGSPVQRLKVFQSINPAIQSTSKDVIVDFEHEDVLFQHYLQFSEVDYQLKNFGKGFYDNHVELDGKHRTRFNQILQTGRLSSVSPNMLNIPRKFSAYREAIIPDPGFEMIDADFDGQELVIVAHLANETSWLDYLKKDYDLHSRNSELIFGDEWVSATEDGCEYYAEHPNVAKGIEGFVHKYKKCSCEGHKEMRDASKAVSFGSIYGISYFKLAFNLKISEERAKFILQKFFEIAPGISRMMQRFGSYGLAHGYITEPVFGRVRYFDTWKLNVPAEHGAVERACFNTPIQSSGSSILKIAFVLMRRWINHNNLQDKIQLLLPYHDETLAQAVITEDRYYIELAKEKVAHYMRLAAILAGFPIGASAKSGASWLEAH